MATHANSTDTSCETTNAAGFDPVDWLNRFQAVGGYWLVTPDERMTIGWMLDGYTIEQTQQARTIWRELGPGAELLPAIRAHLIAGRA